MNIFRVLTGKPNEDEFAQIVMKEMDKNGFGESIVYDSKDFKLIISGDRDNYLYLNNAYQDYLQTKGKGRKEVIKHYIQLVVSDRIEVPKSFEEAKDDIFPVIRSRVFVELTNLRNNLHGKMINPIPYQMISENLALTICYDTPNSVMYLGKDHFKEWHISFEDVIKIAEENLLRKTLNFSDQVNTLTPGVFLFDFKDAYNTSRLIFWDFLNHLNVKGKPVVGILDRETLVVTGSEDANGLIFLASFCEKAFESTRFISAIPVILENKAWITFYPAQSAPAYLKFKECELREKMMDYNEQKKLLEQMYQNAGEDIFVASYTLLEKKETKELISYCIWIRGVTSVLPVTERIVFMKESNEIFGVVTWKDAFEVLGDIMKPEVEYPLRYRVEVFPSTEQFELLNLEKDFF